MPRHRRRLPHVYVEGRALFVTWHLHGSVPPSLLPPPRKASAGQAFVWIDRQLDSARNGPMHLRQPEIVELVVRSIHKGAGLYELGAYVVMANHVQIPLVKRERRDESRRGTHECVRYVYLKILNRRPSGS